MALPSRSPPELPQSRSTTTHSEAPGMTIEDHETHVPFTFNHDSQRSDWLSAETNDQVFLGSMSQAQAVDLLDTSQSEHHVEQFRKGRGLEGRPSPLNLSN
eukprot:4763684-Pyramimonas_sp.AAC.1